MRTTLVRKPHEGCMWDWIRKAVRRLGWSVRYRGLPFTLLFFALVCLRQGKKEWFIRYREQQFDRRHGVDTAGVVELCTLGLEGRSPNRGTAYTPSTPEIVSAAIASLRLPLKQYVFLDLGSGKGLALLIAATFPFQLVIGVEFSQQLCQISRRNAASFTGRHPGARSIEVVHADAAEFPLPPHPSVIYLFNPFPPEVIGQFIEHLGRSLQQTPRHVVVIYNNPLCDDLFAAAPFLQRRPFEGAATRLAMYESRYKPCRPVQPHVAMAIDSRAAPR